MVWEDTGLRWIPTSPNIPTIGAARGYTATGFLGEIGIETGLGGPALSVSSRHAAAAGTQEGIGTALQRAAAFRACAPPPYQLWRATRASYLAMDPRHAGNL